MKYKIVNIDDSHKILESLVSELGSEFQIDGIWEKDTAWEVFFPGDSDDAIIKKFLTHLSQSSDQSIRFTISEFNDDGIDWNKEWKKNYKPVKISETICVYPSWFEIPAEANDKINIRIDPQMGFGTGTHETTQLMMELIEVYRTSPGKVLDAGTGSGILSILVKKLNNQNNVIAFDPDPDAISNAQVNHELNSLTGIKWITGELPDIRDSEFDLIMANINRSVLMDLIHEFHVKLKPGALMILSGILFEEKEMICNRCNSLGFEEIQIKQKNEWIGGVWKK